MLSKLASGLPAVSLAIAALCAACSDGGGGDLDHVPPTTPSAIGDGARLSTLNDPANPRPPENAEVYVSGISVVAVDSYDETANGKSVGNIYAQDLSVGGAPPPYGGITLYNSSFSPPSLRVAPGDVIDARGVYQEFPGPSSGQFSDGATLPELVGPTLTLRFEYDVPDPITINLQDLASYQTGRQWIGMLVRIENAVAYADIYCGSSDPGACDVPGQRHSISLTVEGVTDTKKMPALTNSLFDLKNSGVPTTAGSTYASIVAVVQYFYNFQLAARSAEDIVAQ